jgi:hypothetical protein
MLLGLLAVMAAFHVTMSANSRALLGGYGMFFTAKACSMVAVNLLGRSAAPAVTATTLAVQSVVLLYWVFTLRQENEAQAAAFRRSATAE